MSFEILPAELPDVPAIVAIHQAAFQDGPITGRLWCDVGPQVRNDNDMRYFDKAIRDRLSTGCHLSKLIDHDTGKLVAFAKWTYPKRMTPEQEEEKRSSGIRREFCPEGTNMTLYNQFAGQLNTLRVKHMDERKDYFLHVLAVSPSHQRRGLGSILIREGLTAADRDNARTYIEASPAGLGLYKKFGWKEVEAVHIDMTPHGGTGIATEQCLIREPHVGMA